MQHSKNLPISTSISEQKQQFGNSKLETLNVLLDGAAID